MYNKTIRDEAYLKSLCDFIHIKYDIEITLIAPAKRGYYGETWKIETNHLNYFVKIDYSNFHKLIYRDSFKIVEYLRLKGIEKISKIIKTMNDDLYVEFSNGILGIFEYVDGKNHEEYELFHLFNNLSLIYKIEVSDLQIQVEDFNTGCIDVVYENIKKLQSKSETDLSAQRILGKCLKNRRLIDHVISRLELFAARCKDKTNDFHITHGDAGGNVIINGDSFVIVDWDHPKYAPIERDAWFFICDDNNIAEFNQILLNNGINYTLQKDRLAFYCYYSFLFYLQEYLCTYFDLTNEELKKIMAHEVHDFFHSWILNQISIADQYK